MKGLHEVWLELNKIYDVANRWQQELQFFYDILRTKPDTDLEDVRKSLLSTVDRMKTEIDIAIKLKLELESVVKK